MANLLNFKFGLHSKLPAAKTAGTVYITTDEQAMYVDLPKDSTSGELKRVRIGDIIVKDSVRDAKPPFAEGAFYYFAKENALLRWYDGAWKQVNSTSDVEADLSALSESLDAEILRSTTKDNAHDTAIKALQDDVAARVTTADFNAFKGTNTAAINEAKQAGLTAQAAAKTAQDAAEDAQDAADEANKGLATKLSLSGAETMKGDIKMGSYKITGLGDPVNNTDAATKAYVDSAKSAAVKAAEDASKAAAAAQKTADEAGAAAAQAQGTADGAMGRANDAYTLAESKATMAQVLEKGYATVGEVNAAKNAVIGKEGDKVSDITVYGAHAAAAAALAAAQDAQETADSKTTMADVEKKNYATKTEAEGYAKAVQGNTTSTVKTVEEAAAAAMQKAQTGVDNAALAKSAADDAQDTADQAKRDAATADEKARNAQAAAEAAAAAAKSADDNAKTRVLTNDFEAFKTTNTKAIEDVATLADTAQDTADGAVTAAGNAQKDATQALKDAAAASALANKMLPLAGGTMTGPIAMSNKKITGLAAPTNDSDAATKAYVDAEAKKVSDALDTLGDEVDSVSGVATAAMPKAGGTFVGNVTMGAGTTLTVLDPTAPGHAANKGYVDSAIADGIKANDAMTFKGTVGTNATVTTLPTSGVQKGDTYKVATAGTYATIPAKVGDLFINVADDDATPSWTHVSSGYEDDYLQKLVVDSATIHLTDGVSNNASGSVGGIKFQGANTSNIVMKVTAGTGDNPVHIVEASMVWGEF